MHRLPQGLQKDRPHDTLTVGPTPEPREQLCVSPPAYGPALWRLSETDHPVGGRGEGWLSGKVSLPPFSS